MIYFWLLMLPLCGKFKRMDIRPSAPIKQPDGVHSSQTKQSRCFLRGSRERHLGYNGINNQWRAIYIVSQIQIAKCHLRSDVGRLMLFTGRSPCAVWTAKGSVLVQEHKQCFNRILPSSAVMSQAIKLHYNDHAQCVPQFEAQSHLPNLFLWQMERFTCTCNLNSSIFTVHLFSPHILALST